jgi:hypothetical protein
VERMHNLAVLAVLVQVVTELAQVAVLQLVV